MCDNHDGENMISITIKSYDGTINDSISCKTTDKFNQIEIQIYEKYPEYMSLENFFLANGYKINKYKTLEENRIKNGDIILMKSMDE